VILVTPFINGNKTNGEVELIAIDSVGKAKLRKYGDAL
jgi:hypothetical protein